MDIAICRHIDMDTLIYRYKRRFIIEIGSHDHGGQEFPSPQAGEPGKPVI